MLNGINRSNWSLAPFRPLNIFKFRFFLQAGSEPFRNVKLFRTLRGEGERCPPNFRFRISWEEGEWLAGILWQSQLCSLQHLQEGQREIPAWKLQTVLTSVIKGLAQSRAASCFPIVAQEGFPPSGIAKEGQSGVHCCRPWGDANPNLQRWTQGEKMAFWSPGLRRP